MLLLYVSSMYQRIGTSMMDIEGAKKSIASLFNLSSSQVYYLLGLELRKLGALKYEELQKENEEVLRYYQIVAPNNKKL